MEFNTKNKDVDFLYYLIEEKMISHKELLLWAYSQYTEDGVKKWIEEISYTYFMYDVLDMLRYEFDISSIDNDLIISEIAYEYFYQDQSVYLTVCKLFQIREIFDEVDMQEIYTMDHYMYDCGGDEYHEKKSKIILDELLLTYKDLFKNKIESFKKLL